jgi:hypothetical protein
VAAVNLLKADKKGLVTRNNIPLGRFLIFALPTWMLADSYFPAEFKHWPPLLYWVMGAVTAAALRRDGNTTVRFSRLVLRLSH